jgi:hypothetical protein
MFSAWENSIEKLSKLQHRFIKVAQQIDESNTNRPGVCGSWSPKEVVAHIIGWDKEVIRQFGLFQDGLEKAIEHDIDEFNRKSVKERSHLSWEETLAELQQAHEQFYQQAKSISSKELSKNEEYKDWVEVQIDHYKHHTKQLEKWV